MTPSGHYHIGGNNNDVNDADDDADSDADDDDEKLILGKPINRSNVHPTGLYEELQFFLQIYLSSFRDHHDYLIIMIIVTIL